jgi:hypothetical protein
LKHSNGHRHSILFHSVARVQSSLRDEDDSVQSITVG